MSDYSPLDTVNLDSVTTLVNPPHSKLNLDSDAIYFMTDFTKVHPVLVSDNTEIDEALRIMKQSHVRLLLVSDVQNETFVGVISATDVNSNKVLAYMAKNQISHRSEVLVRHIMTDKEHVHGLDFEKVEKSSIGKVLQTIKNLNEQHVLVVDNMIDAYCIRGLFSTTDLMKALHIKFDVEPHAKTFFELEQVILHH